MVNDSTVPQGIKVLTKGCNEDIVNLGVFCIHSMIPRGTRFGPFTGKIVFPRDIIRGEDNPHMWEVSHFGLIVKASSTLQYRNDWK